MRIIVAALWVVLFVVLFAFAVNNTETIDLRFFAGMAVKAPLIALLLVFFIAGFAFGFVALMPSWVRQRVEIRRLRRLAVRPADAPVAGPRGGPRDAPPAPGSLLSTDVIQSVARGARTTT